VLNQIGRRLTEELYAKKRRHRLLLMLDEFPALGRLDFFESALAFMAGYGLKSFLLAQSLNQIEKAYGSNNAILDNWHVRVAFATNDERTARRVSDALGTATEMRALTNYAGHRLSPWLGHLMVSSGAARPLLTPGEVMQLPPADELVLVSGIPPIRAKKARYYEDAQLKNRVLPPPALTAAHAGTSGDRPVLQADDWTTHSIADPRAAAADTSVAGSLMQKDDANGGLRREPTLPGHEAIVPEIPKAVLETGASDDVTDHEVDDEAVIAKAMNPSFRGLARQAALDPDDGLGL
jgi:type IV secretion system protein VirD4